MKFLQPFFSIYMIFSIFFGGVIRAEDNGANSFVKAKISRNLIVDKLGHGDFRSVQQAIDSVPPNNNKWIRIFVKPGRYMEKVTIPKDKPFIVLEGSGRTITKIAWDGHNGMATSSTFCVNAENFVAKKISFMNTYNHVPRNVYNESRTNERPRTQAVAAEIFADKSSFYECGFFGLQDTLFDDQGRHYFYECYIEGAVDFIFGQGQSIYEKCAISVIAGNLQEYKGLTGFITAQNRQKRSDTNGFVFKHCRVFGNGTVYLGRPWGPFARVLFYFTYMSNVVVPKGWQHWSRLESGLTFAEADCYGPGSKTSHRVPWEKKLSKSELTQLLNLSFINKDRWIEQQP